MARGGLPGGGRKKKGI